MDRYAIILFLAALPIVSLISSSRTSNAEDISTPHEPLSVEMTEAKTFAETDAMNLATTVTEPGKFSFDKRLSGSIGGSSVLPTTYPGLFNNADNSDVHSGNVVRDENVGHTTDGIGLTESLDTTASKMNDTFQVTCDDGWSPYEDFCFYLLLNIPHGKSFSDFESDCRRLGGHLSTIHSEKERGHIVHNINVSIPSNFFTNNQSSDSVWIGLYFRAFNGWYTTDGSAPDFVRGILSQTPSSNVRNTSACISILPFSGEFLIGSCNIRKHGAMCKSRGVRIFNNDQEVIYSPNYPGNYDSSVTEKYLIQAPEGFMVSLTFDFFQLEGDFPSCSFDFLIIYDGDATSNSVLGKYCGENVPLTLYSSSNELFVKFVSDEWINKQGFCAKGTFLPNTKPAASPTFESRRSSVILSSVLVGVICTVVTVIFTVLFFLRLWKTYNNANSFPGSGRSIINIHEETFRKKNDKQVTVESINDIPLKDVKEFRQSRLSIKSCIGKGAFSFVYKAKAVGVLSSDEITSVAVKILKDNVTEKEKQDFLYEMQLLNDLDHPNVVSFYGFCRSDEHSVCLIMEYLENGSLLHYLRSFSERQTRLSGTRTEKDSTMITSKELMRFGLEIANGMEYLASKNLVHRDLAARNILLGDNLQCKVSDLGLARILKYSNEYEMRSKSRVPVRWMSPESILRNKYSTASDVWSFGVVLWEIATLGSHPYPGLGCTQIVDDVKKGMRLLQPAHCHDEIYSMMMTCWQYNPFERPGFSDLRQKLDEMLEKEMDYFEMENFKEDEYVFFDEEDPCNNESFEETA